MKRYYSKIFLALAALLSMGLLAWPAMTAGTQVLHLPFDEAASATTFSDLSGNGYHATCAGAACPLAGRSGWYGAALNFDGTNDYVEIPYQAALNPASFTVSAWVKVTGGSGYRAVWTSRDDTPQRGYILYAMPDNTWEFWVGTGAGGWVSTGGAPVTNDVWTHLATVYDAGAKTMTLYVNGQLASSRANVTLARNTQRPFRVGAGVTEGAPQFFFAGLIDDVRVHGNALSQAEIQALSIAALHLPLDEAGGATTFTDVSGSGHNGTCAGAACPTAGQTGVYGAALNFDGTNDYVEIPYQTALNPASFTVAAWVKVTGGGGHRAVWTSRDDTPQRGYILYAMPDNTWEFWMGTGAGGWVSTGGAPVTNDVWTHLATVYDASAKTMALYVNGQLTSSRANVTLARNTQRPFRLGAGVTEGAPQFFFAGLIDDARVYAAPLSAAAIQSMATAPQFHLPLDEAAGTRAFANLAGAGYGACSGDACPTAGIAGTTRAALDFDGQNDVLHIPPTALNNLAEGTLAAWVYLDNNQQATLMAKQHDGVNSYGVLSVGYTPTQIGDPGRIFFHAQNGAPLLQSSTLLQTGQWYHVAVTFDGGQACLYVNGQQDACVTGANLRIPDDVNVTATTLGAHLGSAGGRYLDGRLDDVRIYGRLLSATELQAILLPAAPANLQVASAGGAQIGLQWQDTSGNESGFKLERSPDGSSNWTQIATFAADATAGTDGTAACGTTHHYRLRAYNALGHSAYSNVVSGATLACPPGIPAAPSNLSASNVQPTAATLTWSDNSSDETDFQVTRSPNGADGWMQVGVVGANVTSFTDAGLTCATTYYYAVHARNAQGQATSNVIAVTSGDCAPPPPAAPSHLSASNVQKTAATLSWSDNSDNETGFKVERSPDGSTGWAEIATLGANVATHTDTGLTCNTRYSYRVRAANANGDSAPSAVVDVLTSACSSKPTTLSESFDNSSLPAGWSVNPTSPAIQTWAFDNPGNRTHESGGSGGFASVDSDRAGSSATLNAELRTPALDLSAHASVKLRFKTFFRAYGNSVADVDVSVDGGATWTNIWRKTRADARGSITLDVPQAAGKGDVVFRFRYYEANYAWYWQIDDVEIADALRVSPPAAPGNLNAEVSGDDIRLTWADNSSTEAHFIIERSADGSGGWTEAGRVSADATTFTHAGLDCNTTVHYRVKAINGNLESGYSNSAHATTPVCAVTISAIDENFNAGASLPEGWTLVSMYGSGFMSWQIKPPTDGGAGYAPIAETGRNTELRTPVLSFRGINAVALSFDSNMKNYGVQQYYVAVDISKDGGATWTTLWRKNTSFHGREHVNLDISAHAANQSNVMFRFFAHLYYGNEFWEIDNVRINQMATPATPTDFSVTLSPVSDALLAWRGSAGAKYKIERATGGVWTQIADVTDGATTYVDSSTASHTTYQYRVQAYNTAGQSGYTTPASVTTEDKNIRYVDLTVSLYAGAPIATAADRAKYEANFQYFADGVYEASNGAHRLRNITIYRDGQNMGNVDIEWIQSCHPNAHPGGYGKGGGLRVQMCNAFNADYLVDPQAGGYGPLTHEWGHYFYGLYDEYKGNVTNDNIGFPQATDVASQLSAMSFSGYAADSYYGDLRWLNFSAATSHFSMKTAQGRVFGANAWTVLARPKSQDPQNGYAQHRTYWPELAAVAPAAGELPRIDLTQPGARDVAREKLNIVWVPGFTTRVTHGPQATLAVANGAARQIVIDRSALMADSGQLDATRSALGAFINAAQPGDTLGLIAFDGSATVVQPLTDIVDQSTKDTLIAAVNALTGGTAQTNPGAALQLALDGLTATHVPTDITRAVYLLTAGSGDTGPYPITLVPDYQDAYIPLHVFGFDPDAGTQTELRYLADLTGGDYTTVRTGSELQKALRLTDQTTVPDQEVMLVYDEWYIDAENPISVPVVVDASLYEVEFEVTYFGEPLSATVELVDPFGDVYEMDLNEDCETWDEGEDAETTCYVAFEGDIHGEWELNITPTEELYVMYFAGARAAEGAPTYHATCEAVGRDVVAYPDPIIVQAAVNREYPIAGLYTVGWVYGPEGDVLEVDFRDDGVAPDIIADDGIYSAYVDYLGDGEHWITVQFDNYDEEAFYTDRGVTVHEPQDFPEITENFNRYAEVQVFVTGWQEDDHTDWPDDPDWPATALPVDNTPVSGRIDFADDADIFQITVPADYASDTLAVRINRLGLEMDPYVFVYAADYAWEFEHYLEFYPDSDDLLFFPVSVTPGETFYVEVWHYDEEAETGVYQISAGPHLWSDPIAARQSKGEAGLQLSPGYTQTVAADTVVAYVHTLTNTGTITDTYYLEAANDLGWDVELSNADWPEGTLYLRLVEIAPQAAHTFAISVTVPAGAADVTAYTTVTATSQLDDSVFVTATDVAIIIAPGEPASIDVVTADGEIELNGSTAITATLRTLSGDLFTDTATITFTSSLGTVAPASVDTTTGIVTATFTAGDIPGMAIITATHGALVGTATINIVTADEPATLVVTTGASTLDLQGSTAITATLRTLSGDLFTDTATITFTSNLGDVTPASGDTTTGIVTATFTAGDIPGTATITATNGLLVGVASITIEPLVAPPHTVFLPLVVRNH